MDHSQSGIIDTSIDTECFVQSASFPFPIHIPSAILVRVLKVAVNEGQICERCERSSDAETLVRCEMLRCRM
jgi:hypothetical protein